MIFNYKADESTKKWPNEYMKSVKVMGHSTNTSGHDRWPAVISTPAN